MKTGNDINIDSAMEIFGIDNISNVDTTELKKKYKNLMRQYHPDVYKGGDDKAKEVSLAYNMILSISEKLSQLASLGSNKGTSMIFITLSELIKLYNGETLSIKVKDKMEEFTKSDIRQHNTYIISDVMIYHNGLHLTFTNTEPWNLKDEYNVHCDLYVNNLTSDDEVRIGILDSMKDIHFDTESIKVVIREKFNIKVAVTLNKKLASIKK